MSNEREALSTDANFYRALFEQLPDAVVIIDGEHRILDANRAAREQLTELADLIAPDGGLSDFFAAVVASRTARAEARVVDQTGNPRVLSVRGIALGADRIAVLTRDFCAQCELEAAPQMRRVKSLGYVTASLVHDFNNILSPITTLSTLIANELEPGSRLSGYAHELRGAVRHAAALVNQIHTFVQRQARGGTSVHPVAVLTEMQVLLQRVAGSDVDVVLSLDEPVCDVAVDRVELEQVILNLVSNARDAMPCGGRVTIGAKLVHLGHVEASQYKSPRLGVYAALTVTDTGVGMSPEVLGRLFEPFFTTKPEGTGLGLATARRFALLHGGWIAVESELGRGTTLTLFLPCAENKNTAEVPHRAAIS